MGVRNVPSGKGISENSVLFTELVDHAREINNTAQGVTAVVADVAVVQGDLATAQGDITTAQGDISTLQAAILSIGAYLDKFQSFQVTLTADILAVDLTPADYNLVTYDTVVWDDAGYYNTSTGKFQPTEPGRWSFTAAALERHSATGDKGQIAFYKNGSVVAYGNYIEPFLTTASWNDDSFVMDFNGTTDYLEIFLYVPSTVIKIDGTADSTYLTGFFVGNPP